MHKNPSIPSKCDLGEPLYMFEDDEVEYRTLEYLAWQKNQRDYQERSMRREKDAPPSRILSSPSPPPPADAGTAEAAHDVADSKPTKLPEWLHSPLEAVSGLATLPKAKKLSGKDGQPLLR
jgi:hypothetical protein